ncbi:SDR family NAD(P)-dependent oxidoreductase [Amycolatopsis sp. CA-161197]|uniref:SDR family NAD(P)-dependent oxidoreductase n=1 Tax=Amycolatopsis sp. CA-161197 TaxID=3239922 RepID=UPI003D8F8B0D
MSLDGKAALVTGASSGIGKGVAERPAKDGARVIVAHHPAQRGQAEEVVNGIAAHGGTAITAAADVADAAQVRGLFDVAETEFDGVDIVVSNAADYRFKSLAGSTDEDFDTVFATNTRAGFVAMRSRRSACGPAGES